MLAYRYPNLKKELRAAHVKGTPDEYIYTNLKKSMLNSFLLTVASFFILDKAGLPKILLLFVFLIVLFFTFNFSILKLKGMIKKREREI